MPEDSVRVYDGVNGWLQARAHHTVDHAQRAKLFGSEDRGNRAFPNKESQDFNQWRSGNAMIGDEEVAVAQGLRRDSSLSTSTSANPPAC